MRRSKSEPRMETMMELKHPRRLEKKANIRSDRQWSDMWSGLSEAAAIVRSRAERRRANQCWLPLIATVLPGFEATAPKQTMSRAPAAAEPFLRNDTRVRSNLFAWLREMPRNGIPFLSRRAVSRSKKILIHGFPLATNRRVWGTVASLLVPKFRNCLLQYSS
jgi:hypothetical protein